MKVDSLELTVEQTMLIKENEGLVHKIAQSYAGMLPHDELYHVGTIGLVRAIMLYDESKGAKFSTYAGMWIRKRMMDAITKHNRPIKGSKETNQMAQFDEIFGDEAQTVANDYFVSEHCYEMDMDTVTEHINKALADLDEIEQEVIIHMYGLNGNDETTLEELADIHGYSITGIKAIKERARKKLSESISHKFKKEMAVA